MKEPAREWRLLGTPSRRRRKVVGLYLQNGRPVQFVEAKWLGKGSAIIRPMSLLEVFDLVDELTKETK